MADLQILDLIFICCWNICRRPGDGRGRLRFWHRRRRRVAACSVAGPHNGADRGLRIDRAGNLRLEVASVDKADAATAVLAWRSDRRPNWRRTAALGISRDPPHFNWNSVDSLQHL